MPRKGYQAVTISLPVYKLIKEFIEMENKKEGYRKWRSISQFVETALMEYFKRKTLEEKLKIEKLNKEKEN